MPSDGLRLLWGGHSTKKQMARALSSRLSDASPGASRPISQESGVVITCCRPALAWGESLASRRSTWPFRDRGPFPERPRVSTLDCLTCSAPKNQPGTY